MVFTRLTSNLSLAGNRTQPKIIINKYHKDGTTLEPDFGSPGQ